MKTKNFYATINVAWGFILRALCVLASIFSGTATITAALVMAVMLNATLGINQSSLPWVLGLSINALSLILCVAVVVFAAINRRIAMEIDHVYGLEDQKTTLCCSCFLYSIIASPMVGLGASGVFIGSIKDTLWLAEQNFGMFFIYAPIACVLSSLTLYVLLAVISKYYA